MSATVSTQRDRVEIVTPLPAALHSLLRLHSGGWQGTAGELCSLLNLHIAPRALSVKLHDPGTVIDLQRAGITVTYTRKHGVRLILITEAPSIAPVTKKRAAATQNVGDANLAHDSTPVSEAFIAFPWHWEYSEIRELSLGERQAVTGRRCGLCHARVVVTHEKRCGVNPRTLLCRGCAFNYIQKANRVMQKWKDEGDVG
jgi:hypothetical protein